MEEHEIIEALTRLETTLKVELKAIHRELTRMQKSIERLNEEYGALSTQVRVLEERTNAVQSHVRFWKIFAIFVSPILATVVSKLIEFFWRV